MLLKKNRKRYMIHNYNHRTNNKNNTLRRLNMLTAIIVDDDRISLNLLSYQLQKTGDFETIHEYSSPFEALKNIPVLQPDVIFLDIEMPGLSGIDLAAKLRKMNIETPIIFITAHRNYAYEAFRVGAFNYLLKPYSMKELQQVLIKLKKSIAVSEYTITSLIDTVPSLEDTKSLSEKPMFSLDNVSSTTVDPSTQSACIRCFGKFEVQNGKGNVVKWSSKKAKELLAYFILHSEQNLDKWIIGEALWPENNDKNVNNGFHTTLHRLRNILSAEEIDFQLGSEKGKHHGYIYTPTMIECDVFQFNDFIARNLTVNCDTIHEFESIRQLFRGELLSELECLWCIPQREKYLQVMLDILENMGIYYLQNTKYKNAYLIFMQSLSLDYSCEATHQHVLEALFLQKNKLGLMNHYKNFHNFFIKELDTEPDSTSLKLYKQYLKDL